MLHVFDLFWGEWLCGVNLHPLNSCTILDWSRFVGSRLGSDRLGVLVFCKGFVDVAGHVAMDMSLNIIPGEFYSTK